MKDEEHPCRNKRRYESVMSARAHWRSKGHDVVKCSNCNGYHLERRKRTEATA